MFIPIGVERSLARRLPIVTAAVVLVNALVFAAGPQREDERRVHERYEDVRAYWAAHPYLELPPTARSSFRWEPPGPSPGHLPPDDPAELEAQQRRLDALTEELVATHEATFERRYALVPARGLWQPGWITSLFLHADLAHIAFNLLFFVALGAWALESAWGHVVFAAFYLLGGVVANGLEAALDPTSVVSSLGASGAISASIGAVTVHFFRRRVRLLVWFWTFFRTVIPVPAWAYGGFLFLGNLAGLARSGQGSGVAYAAHVGGFLFGIAVAFAIRISGLATRLRPADDPGPDMGDAELDAIAALESGHLVQAERLWREVVEAEPSHRRALLSLARIAAQRRRPDDATRWGERLLEVLHAAGDEAAARRFLAEHGHELDARRLRPVAAYRVAGLLRESDPIEANRFEAAAERAAGLVGLKATIAVAERIAPTAPEEARVRAESVAASAEAPAGLRERAAQLLATLAARREGSTPDDPGALELDRRVRFEAAEPSDQGEPAPAPGDRAEQPRERRSTVVPGRPAPRCTRHPGARAGWRCRECEALLCPGCAAARSVQEVEYVVCCSCGAPVELLLVHRRDRWPLADRLGDAFRFPLRPGALATIAIMALAIWGLDHVPFIGTFLGLAIGFGTFFQAIRSTGRGHADLGAFELDDGLQGLFAPLARGVAGLGGFWLVLALHGATSGTPHGQRLWLYALDLLAAWYVPAALLLPACGFGLRHVMDPFMVVRTALRLGRDHLATAACVGAIGVAEISIIPLAERLASTGVPLVSGWLAIAVASYLPFVAARLLGLLIWVRGDALGIGLTEFQLEPALARAVPRGRAR